MTATGVQHWPSIPVDEWAGPPATRCTSIPRSSARCRMTNEPLLNHWWNTTLYLTARGLTTSLMPHPTGPAFQVDFDFVEHRLTVLTVDGAQRSLELTPRPVMEFYDAVMSMLDVSRSPRRSGRCP